MRAKGKIVVWPLYFDSDLSWRQGRRVPKALALRDVKAEEILQVALDLGLQAELQAGVPHPSRPWERKGVVLINKSGAKTKFLMNIARKIREKRGSK